MAPISQLSSLLAALKASKSHAHAWEGAQESTYAYMLRLPAPSFERSFNRLQEKLVAKEQRFRQLLAASKARAKQELRQLVAGTPMDTAPPATPAHAASLAPAAPSQEQLDSMFGSDGWLRSTVLTVIGTASHAFMHHANTVHINGGEVMREAMERPQGQALVTVSNHVAALDDPLVVAAILPTDVYNRPSALRWTLCATDRCFKYASLAPFFTAAKVLPVQRGAGMQQPGMVAAEARLAQGDWVHIFPEGTRARDPSRLGPVRKGVGRLVAAAAAAAPPGTPPPLVVPWVHAGMDKIMPVGSKLPTVGNEVHVLVGQPIPVDDLLTAARQDPQNSDKVYAAISSRIEQHMQRLHQRVQRMAAGQVAMDEDMAEGAPVQGLGVAAQATRPWWPYAVAQSGPAGVFWGPRQQRLWEHTAFGMWHRAWAERIAYLHAAGAQAAV